MLRLFVLVLIYDAAPQTPQAAPPPQGERVSEAWQALSDADQAAWLRESRERAGKQKSAAEN